MKDLFKRSLILVLFLTTIITRAEGVNPTFKINSVESNFIYLRLNNFDSNINLLVKDTNGVVLYNEDIKQTYFAKKYDLTKLPKGNYFFEINGNSKIKTIPVSVNSNSVVLDETKATIYFKPNVRIDGENIYITKLALNKELLEVNLLDTDGTLVYNAKLKDKVSLGTKLNLSKLERGEYNLLLTSDGKTFIEKIKI